MEQGLLSKETAPTARLGAPGAATGVGGEWGANIYLHPCSQGVRGGPKPSTAGYSRVAQGSIIPSSCELGKAEPLLDACDHSLLQEWKGM